MSLLRMFDLYLTLLALVKLKKLLLAGFMVLARNSLVFSHITGDRRPSGRSSQWLKSGNISKTQEGGSIYSEITQ